MRFALTISDDSVYGSHFLTNEEINHMLENEAERIRKWHPIERNNDGQDILIIEVSSMEEMTKMLIDLEATLSDDLEYINKNLKVDYLVNIL